MLLPSCSIWPDSTTWNKTGQYTRYVYLGACRDIFGKITRRRGDRVENEKYRKELIAKILVEKNKTGLSYQAIADLTANIGNAVSSHTVWRALTQSTNVKIATLMTIAEAMGIEVDRNDPELLAENHALAVKVELLERQLADKSEQIQSMRDLVRRDEEHIARQVTNMEKKDRRILLLTIACCVMLAVSVLLLGFDIVDPNMGYILGH